MTIIKPECVDNAIGMLRGKQSRFLGWIGNIRYYIVDGIVWSHVFGGKVSRCDNHEESDQIREWVSHLNKENE